MLSKATFTYFNICLLHIHHTIIQVIQTQTVNILARRQFMYICLKGQVNGSLCPVNIIQYTLFQHMNKCAAFCLVVGFLYFN